MRVLSFSHALPYEGVPYAGGEYYLRHVRALVESGHQVTIVAPATAANVGVRVPEGIEVVLIEEWTDLATRGAGAVVRLFRYAVQSPAFARAVIADSRVHDLVRRSDLLEYQWVAVSSIHRRLLRRCGVQRPAVCVAHDVVAQSMQRWADQPGASRARRLLRRVRVPIARRDEGRQLRALDLVLTFSDKDVRLLEAYGVRAELINPPLAAQADARPAVNRTSMSPRLLFVGAFDRLENVDAVEWLLADIWPSVRRTIPDARLSIVGARPTAAMLQAAQQDDRIEVTGYVADLAAVYEAATLAVVPLRLGAGVKFKVVTALLEGLPVVTTSVGAEGIPGRRDELFVAVEDRAEPFARAVIDHLLDPARGTLIARTARQSAAARYGWSAFRARLEGLYAGVVSSFSARAARAGALRAGGITSEEQK